MQLGDQVYYIVFDENNSWLPFPDTFNGFHVEWANVVSINKDVFLLEKPGWIFSKKILKKRSELFSSRAEVYASVRKVF